MILQYSNGITECYEEAQSISIGEIGIDDGWTPAEVMIRIGEKIKGVWGEPKFEFRTDRVILDESKKVRFAIINHERSKEKVLLFNDRTILYLFNDKLETLKMF